MQGLQTLKLFVPIILTCEFRRWPSSKVISIQAYEFTLRSTNSPYAKIVALTKANPICR